MKKLILLYIVLCLIPLTSAELEVDDIRMCITNDDECFDIDDGDDIDVNRGDSLELQVIFDNDMDNETRVRLQGIIEDIDDGNDIRKPDKTFSNIDWEVIDENDDYNLERLYFTVPSDASYNDYDLDLRIAYKYYNGTQPSDWKYKFDINVLKESAEEIELEDVMRNMSVTCSNVVSQMTETFDYIDRYDDVSTNLSSCREERGTYKSQKDEKEKTLIQCQTDRDNNKNNFDECDEKKKQMVSTSECKTQTDDAIDIAVEEVEKKNETTMIGIGVLVLGLWWFIYKRKKGVSVYDKQYKEKVIP